MKIIVHPGWHDSGPEHWQSTWQNALGAIRVQQADWAVPHPDSWADGLVRAISTAHEPVVVLCHSLGCINLAHVVRRFPDIARNIRGAWLVAPADVERDQVPEVLATFAPIPMGKLPFSAHLVASSNDPFCREERALAFAHAWGCSFEVLPEAGHINTAAGYGEWPDGLDAFKSYLTHLASHA
ncbi:alpha/beta hydrolase [Burkholderiaceae bacterium DAT-1]|nr:alpha/beta hydrolase [Burkholderiaceae bacterium DAT-1]